MKRKFREEEDFGSHGVKVSAAGGGSKKREEKSGVAAIGKRMRRPFRLGGGGGPEEPIQTRERILKGGLALGMGRINLGGLQKNWRRGTLGRGVRTEGSAFLGQKNRGSNCSDGSRGLWASKRPNTPPMGPSGIIQQKARNSETYLQSMRAFRHEGDS